MEAPRRELRAVLGATFFVRFGFGLTVSVFAAYILGRSSGLDADTVGLVGVIAALSPIGEFSTVVLSGLAADRYGRFPVLFGGMAVAAAVLAVVSFTRAAWALAPLNLVFGVASGAILAPSLAVVADRAKATERGREMGRFDAVNLLGWILGFAIGFGLLGLVPNHVLPWVFRLGAALLFAGLVVARYSVGGQGARGRPTTFDLARVRAAILRRDVLLVVLPWLVIYMLIGTAFVFLGTASTGAGIPATYLAAVIGGGGLVLLATQPYLGHLADRYGRFRLMTVGTVGFVLLMAIAALLSTYGPLPVLLGAAGVSILLALAYGPAALAALTDLSEQLTRATTMAVYTLMISLGMITGLAASTGLFAALGAVGLDLFFGSIAAALVVLTGLRYVDLRRAKVASAMV
ncbi:MAG: MFS transporter [Thermoplasmata archaeon]|nr:MFS transporter [Thermoplasmata archaeon]